jgi:hypothetical protein
LLLLRQSGSEETFMNLKLIVAILAIAVVSLCAQTQQPSGAKLKADLQNVVKIISGDKAKTQTYCQIDELSNQVAWPFHAQRLF